MANHYEDARVQNLFAWFDHEPILSKTEAWETYMYVPPF